ISQLLSLKADTGLTELENWIESKVDEQAVKYQDDLIKVMTNLLNNSEAAQYLDVLVKMASSSDNQKEQQQQIKRRFIQSSSKEQQQGDQEESFESSSVPKSRIASKTSSGQQDHQPLLKRAPNQDMNMTAATMNSLMEPFILQLRRDIRNILIWLCAGAPGSKIDGKVYGDDEFSRRATKADITAIRHPKGAHYLADIIDPNTSTLILACLKSYYQDFGEQLYSLAIERSQQAKEAILSKLQELTGVPKFLLPFSIEKMLGQSEGLKNILPIISQSLQLTEQAPGVVREETEAEGGALHSKQLNKAGSSDDGRVDDSGNDNATEGNSDAQKPSEALNWVVDNVLNEFRKTFVETTQEQEGDQTEEVKTDKASEDGADADADTDAVADVDADVDKAENVDAKEGGPSRGRKPSEPRQRGSGGRSAQHDNKDKDNDKVEALGKERLQIPS
ncbi:hypothetical protein BX616_007374, partial [Lobosporangium transversale]